MREMNEDDVPFVVNCLLDLHVESPVYNKVKPDPEYVHGTLNQLFEGGALRGVIEEDKGFMFGFITSNWYDPTIEAHEQLLYVRKLYRGGVLAIKLIRHFENLCIDAGAKKISVGSSTGISDARTEFMYERLGYIRQGNVLSKDLSYVC